MNQPAARYFHVSNLLTYVSLLSGLCAIFLAHKFQNLSAAGGLIALCAVADVFSDRFASLFLRSESMKSFGVQFDGLADALSFGLVPVVCLLQSLNFEYGIEYFMWFAAAFFYIVCAITRLGDHALHRKEREGYVGLPTTIAALIWSSAFLVKPSMATSTVLLIGLGIAMVSPIRICRPKLFDVIILLAWAFLLMGLHAVNV